jgi:outer membrane protein TolC
MSPSRVASPIRRQAHVERASRERAARAAADRCCHSRAASGLGLTLVLTLAAVGTAWAEARPELQSEPIPDSGDPTLATERLTLAQALERAFANNPDLRVAEQEIDRSRGLLQQARAAELPSLLGSGLYTRLDHDRVTSTGLKIGAANQWSANLTLNLPVVLPTAWAGVHRAESAVDLTKTTAVAIRRTLAAAVARAYLGVVLQHRQAEVAVRARDTARVHFDFSHTRLRGGLGNSLDDVRAEQEVRIDQVQLANARAALVRAQATLASLLSRDHLVDVVDEVPLPSLPDPRGALDAARNARADVKVSESRLRGAEHAYRDRWALYSPYLTANGVGFVQDLGSAIQPTRGWQAQLLLTLPLYDGGYRTGVTRERAASEAEARAELDATLRGLDVDVQAAFELVVRADEALAAARGSSQLAHRAAELADLAYRAGATTNLEVVDAEQRARDAETQAALAEDAARQARLDLLLATGRFP